MMKLFCIGDSNTYGYDPRDLCGIPYAHPWPEILEGLSGYNVVNLGLNGREIPRSEYETETLDRQILSAGREDRILVWLGINDILNGRNPEQSSEAMKKYLTHLNTKYPLTPVLLVAPLIPHNLGSIMESNSVKLCQSLKKLANSSHVTFCDCNQWGLETAFDDVHLTEKSHRIFAGKMFQSLI